MTTFGKQVTFGLLVIICAFCFVAKYELGIVKPKFLAGSCAAYDGSNEFEKKVYLFYVAKIEGLDYILKPMRDDGQIARTEIQEPVKAFDEVGVDYPCPTVTVEDIGHN